MELWRSGRDERSSVVSVEAGLYLARYVTASSEPAPLVNIGPSANSRHLIKILSQPGCEDGHLARPGQVAVILASAQAALDVVVSQSVPGGSLHARVDLEPLGSQEAQTRPDQNLRGFPQTTSPYVSGLSQAPARAARGPSLIGHVSNLGDVETAFGEWLGGPERPSPIEGFAFAAPSEEFEGAAEVSVLIGRTDRWTTWQTSERFVGSKGRAMPLTGVRLRVLPNHAGRLRLDASALFLGSPIIRKSGIELEFRGLGGHDPLVGLNIAFVRDSFAAETGRRASSARSGHVRVFRPDLDRAQA